MVATVLGPVYACDIFCNFCSTKWLLHPIGKIRTKNVKNCFIVINTVLVEVVSIVLIYNGIQVYCDDLCF